MVKVITYGTYDLLHYGHIRLLERAKELGDYLIVGITADDFDKTRGKINVKQSLMERIEAVRATGLADEIIVEEYEGQKIDDIRRYNIDIFTVGSDWIGKFDYLNEYCRVIYLPRTEGVSSSELRAEERKIKLGLVGSSYVLNKIADEIQYVNGMVISGVCTKNEERFSDELRKKVFFTEEYERLLEESDAVYIFSHPTKHYEQIKKAIMLGKNVICESPISTKAKQCEELFTLAKEKGCILFEAIKTAYSTAYNRLLVLAKSGKIGDIISVDATCTSLREKIEKNNIYDEDTWNSICGWGPVAFLPVFQLLGTEYKKKQLISNLIDEEKMLDTFTKVDFIYSNAVASIKVGKGVKSEGDLIISGTLGYIYVPSPWWKTDYFEVRYENATDNKRYFYQLDGEGIRYELVAFAKTIESKKNQSYIDEKISIGISSIIEEFYEKSDLIQI